MSYKSLTIQKNFFNRLFSSLLFMVSFVSFGYATDPIPIDINSSVNGDLATATHISALSHNHSQVYTFSLTKETDIVIDLNMADYYWGKLYLLDSNNSIAGETQDNFLRNNKIMGTFEAGTYSIDVTTSESGDALDTTQNFVLSLKENIIQNSVIQLDSITDGALSASSGISPRSKHRAHYYTFTLDEKKDIAITLDADYSRKIYLLDANQTIIASNNMYSNNVTIVQTLESGTYTIDVTTDSENATGIDTLRLKENIISNTDISLGTTVEDEWSLSSGISPQSKKRTHYYTFELLEPTDVKIELLGYPQGTLYLLDTNGSTIDTINIDSYNRKIITKTLNTGIYTIDATTNNYSGNDIGSYTLKLEQNIIETTPIDLNSSVDGNWTESSGISPVTNSYSHYYTFTLTEKKNILIKLDSSTDASLQLLDENNSIIASNYRKIVKILNPGDYTIVAFKYPDNNFGNYSLSLHENIISTKLIALNSETNDEWTTHSGVSPHSRNYTNYYTFTLEKSTDILINVSSQQATHIYLFDSNNTNIGESYGGYYYNNLNNRLATTLPAGTYKIDVSADYDNTIGQYTLTLKENKKVLYPLLFNQQINTQWTTNSFVDPQSKRYIDYYTFSLTALTELTISVQSSATTVIVIRDKNGNYVTSKTGFNKGNILLTQLFEPGFYSIGITSDYNGNELSSYSLLINADIQVPAPIENIHSQNTQAFQSQISWQHVSNNTVGYKIYVNHKLVDTVGSDIDTYTLTGLEPDTQYTYSVIAYNSAGETASINGTLKTKKDTYTWLVPAVYYPMLLSN